MSNGNIPPVEVASRDVRAWVSRLRDWLPGRRLDFAVPLPIVEVNWTDTGVNTDVTPDRDVEIDVTYARSIAIQIQSTHVSNTSTDFDVNVEASVEKGVWDTQPYAEANIGNSEIKTFLIESGPAYIRLRGDNNAAATTGYVTARVFIIQH